jgi:hypothetical protein
MDPKIQSIFVAQPASGGHGRDYAFGSNAGRGGQVDFDPSTKAAWRDGYSAMPPF